VEPVTAAVGNAGDAVKRSLDVTAGGSSANGLITNSRGTGNVPARLVSSLPSRTSQTVVKHSAALP
jgi:hypothetical protein